MADSEQEPKTSTTATDGTEAPEQQPNSEEPKNPDVPADDTPAAGDGSDEDEGSDAGKSDDDGKGDDSAAQKERNRSQYQIRQLVSNNPRMQAIRERLQPWIEDTEDASERKDRQRDVNDYIRDAARAQDDIQRDSEAVAKEISKFNPQSNDFDQTLYQRAMAQYARDMCIEDQNGAVDKNGNPIIVGYRMRLIDYMREKAEDYGLESKSTGSGKQPNSSSNTGKSKGKSKTDKAKMDAAADTPGGASAASSKNKGDEDDPFMAGFNDPYGRHTPQNKHAWSEK